MNGASITTLNFGWYPASAGDFTLGAPLTDRISWLWHCTTGGGSTCAPATDNAARNGSSSVIGLNPTTATEIHNAAHATVTIVPAGTTVHDFVTVTGEAGSPPPSSRDLVMPLQQAVSGRSVRVGIHDAAGQ